MPWAESRILLAERSIEDLYRRLLELSDQLKLVRQQQRAMDQQIPGSDPGEGGGGAFVCLAPSAVAGGAWSGSTPTTPGSFEAEVFQVQGGSATSLGTRFVYNWTPSDTVADKACLLVPDGQGNYVVYAQSCS